MGQGTSADAITNEYEAYSYLRSDMMRAVKPFFLIQHSKIQLNKLLTSMKRDGYSRLYMQSPEETCVTLDKILIEKDRRVKHQKYNNPTQTIFSEVYIHNITTTTDSFLAKAVDVLLAGSFHRSVGLKGTLGNSSNISNQCHKIYECSVTGLQIILSLETFDLSISYCPSTYTDTFLYFIFYGKVIVEMKDTIIRTIDCKVEVLSTGMRLELEDQKDNPLEFDLFEETISVNDIEKTLDPFSIEYNKEDLTKLMKALYCKKDNFRIRMKQQIRSTFELRSNSNWSFSYYHMEFLGENVSINFEGDDYIVTSIAFPGVIIVDAYCGKHKKLKWNVTSSKIVVDYTNSVVQDILGLVYKYYPDRYEKIIFYPYRNAIGECRTEYTADNNTFNECVDTEKLILRASTLQINGRCSGMQTGYGISNSSFHVDFNLSDDNTFTVYNQNKFSVTLHRDYSIEFDPRANFNWAEIINQRGVCSKEIKPLDFILKEKGLIYDKPEPQSIINLEKSYMENDVMMNVEAMTLAFELMSLDGQEFAFIALQLDKDGSYEGTLKIQNTTLRVSSKTYSFKHNMMSNRVTDIDFVCYW
jgi:hypothetical protein